jgi:hypothetical protein
MIDLEIVLPSAKAAATVDAPDMPTIIAYSTGTAPDLQPTKEMKKFAKA